jgi:hypothetical protein
VLRGLGPQQLLGFFGPGRLQRGEGGAQLPQQAMQHGLNRIVLRRWQRHPFPVVAPQPLRQQGVQMRRQLQRASEELQEAHRASVQRGRDAQPPRLRPLPAPHRAHQASLDFPYQPRLLAHHPPHLARQRQRPLPVAHLGQHFLEVCRALQRPLRCARGAPPSPLAAEGHQPRDTTVVALHLHEAPRELAAAEVPPHLRVHAWRE